MSSSFRNRAMRHPLTLVGTLALALAGASSGAWAQQTLFMPGIEVTSGWDSNRQLSTDDESSSENYRATAELKIRRITPRSDTELRPQISYQKFSGISNIDSVEGKLDLRSRYETLKGKAALYGRFRRQDAFNAELGQASFDDGGDPTIPDDVNSGTVSGGITRTNFMIQPSFSYSFTERTDFETTLRYDYLNYDSDLPGERVGYTSPSADFEIVHELSRRLRLGVGPYYDHYERDDGTNESDAYGLTVNLRWRTSEITRSTLRVRAERNEDTTFEPQRVEDKSTAWGVEWIGVRENRVGTTQYRIGRFLQPTSFGGRREVDQLHVQWDHPFNRKTLFRTAVRYVRTNSITDLDTAGDRDQARADVMLRHFFTESFFVSAGYRFAWIDRESVGNADNHSFLLTVGLRAKDPTGGYRP